MILKNLVKKPLHEAAENSLNAVQGSSVEEKKPDLKKTGNWIMVACCVPMVIGAGIILWAMGPDATWSNRISSLAPLALCLGAHFVIHKLIGHSCHKTDDVNGDKK